ncbi:MAG: Asp-tRNA(Asn)/Glu-tRNA(Gln) amidotransferase subunit GatA [Acidobacteria bacterium]|nr:Asp-tRNA(Asn)/Glu-tRNA(Gln) amidotransferase subunit GatA [Acidobacteriota bacterium]
MRTILEAAQALRNRRITSAELTRQSLNHIAKSQPELNAFITVCEEHAVRQAAERDRELAAGADRGPLHGIPIALKDVFETRGIRTTCGSLLFRDHIPERDAAVAERVAAAGAVLVGKTNMHELAYGTSSSNPHFGAVHNPWDTSRVPGGSSGGSGAAVAAGLCYMAMGSDTGGSIRIPAAFCGTVGLKPTYGRVSRYGVMPLDFTLDHMGPLTRSVRDAAIVLQALAGHDPRDHTSSTHRVAKYLPAAKIALKGIRIGVPENFYFERCEGGIAGLVLQMAQQGAGLGARLVEVRVPDIAGLNAVSRAILLAEASACMEPHLDRRDQFGADVLFLLDQGRLLAATDYVQAQRLRRLYQIEFARLFEHIDVLLTPTTPNRAPGIGQTTLTIGGESEDARLAATRFVRGINVLGLPALSLPCGLVEGLPVSAQLIGRAFEEALILRVGAALEDATASTGLPRPL